MSQITTHVLDINRGLPCKGIQVNLCQKIKDDWKVIGEEETDSNGRCKSFLAEGEKLQGGIYRLRFETQEYFSLKGEVSFYPYIDIIFQLDESGSHYHVPLLLSAFGYSTYRGC